MTYIVNSRYCVKNVSLKNVYAAKEDNFVFPIMFYLQLMFKESIETDYRT